MNMASHEDLEGGRTHRDEESATDFGKSVGSGGRGHGSGGECNSHRKRPQALSGLRE